NLASDIFVGVEQIVRHLAAPVTVSTMSVLSTVCCCLVFLALVHTNQSYNPFDKFGVYCKPEAYNQEVSKTGCDSQYVRVKACLGTCASYAYPLDHPPYFKKFCECCKPSSTRWKVFNLPNCATGISPLVQVESAVNCKCSMCT
ncbi:Glycoprotein hormone beta-5, partial [Desmophyllum pertusum]